MRPALKNSMSEVDALPLPLLQDTETMSGTRGALASYLGRLLKEHGMETPALDARILISHAAGVSKEETLRQPDAPLDEKQRVWLFQAARKRLQGTPVSRLIGRRAFWKAEFALSPHVLDPRADSETLIEAAVPELKKIPHAPHILDLGTGSGALLLSLLSERKDAVGIGVDISEKALKQARQNARSLQLAQRASFLASDWARALAPAPSFDIILANPPYIPRSDWKKLPPEVRHDPKIALDGGFDGLRSYVPIFKDIPFLLKESGVAVLEFGKDQEEPLRNMAHSRGLEVIEVRHDLSKTPRAIVLKNKEKSIKKRA